MYSITKLFSHNEISRKTNYYPKCVKPCRDSPPRCLSLDICICFIQTNTNTRDKQKRGDIKKNPP